jgi:uncharacterized membrane protein YgcG
MATLQLQSKDSGEKLACIQSEVSNGKTANVPAVSYVAAGLAGAALLLGGVSAVGAAFAGGSAAAGGSSAAGGMGTISPTFTEVFGWFQGMAMNGMLSVNYPPVYRNFAKNFAFSTGLIPWTQLQTSIDSFRAATGGNLTENSVEYVMNATFVFPDGSTHTNGPALVKRAFDEFVRLAARQIETSVNGTASDPAASSDDPMSTIRLSVSGIQAFAEQVSIPSSNIFMTALLIVAIIIAAIVVGVLLVKVVLEFWALFGSFPKSLAGFRKHYWGSIARAVTGLILLLYGIWVLYCIFQFTHGDSWAAKTLAGVTLAIFTGILAFFSFKIWSTARRLKKLEGDIGALYEDKSIWVRYSLFYESYRRDYWWIFLPTIVYMFAKGCVLAVADGHGMAQTAAQLIIEGLMLILLLWSRPYERRSGNIINIAIQTVRVLSVVCILVFVEQFGIAQTTQTVTGVVLIAVQSALTGILAILIAWNAIIVCCKENPHRKRRKEMGKCSPMACDHADMLIAITEKMQRDTLTSLGARNSLLFDRPKTGSDVSDSLSLSKSGFAIGTKEVPRSDAPARYSDTGLNPMFASPAPGGGSSRPLTPNSPLPGPNASRENLVLGAAPLGGGDTRQPTLPNVGGGFSAGYNGQNPRGYPNTFLQPGYGPGGGYTGGGGGYGYRGPYGGY